MFDAPTCTERLIESSTNLYYYRTLDDYGVHENVLRRRLYIERVVQQFNGRSFINVGKKIELPDYPFEFYPTSGMFRLKWHDKKFS